MASPVALGNGSISIVQNLENDVPPSPISFKAFQGVPTSCSALKHEECKVIYSSSIPPLAKFVNPRAALKIKPPTEQISYLFFRIGMPI
jgi:hypothetical protein